MNSNHGYSVQIFKNSVIIDKNTPEITVWISEVPKSIQFSYHIIGNASVTFSFTYRDSPDYNFSSLPGNTGGYGSGPYQKHSSISISLFPGSVLNPISTVYWEVSDITNEITPSVPLGNFNFDFNLELRSAVIGAFVTLTPILILAYINKTRVSRKPMNQEEELYPSADDN